MTAADDPLDELDELASAYLDDAATAGERARVEADPALVARVAELAAARDRVRVPLPPLDPVARDELIANALAAFDAPDATARRTPASLAARRSRLRATAPWLGAAAALLAIALAVSALGLGGGADDRGTAASSAGAGATTARERTALDSAAGSAGGSTSADQFEGKAAPVAPTVTAPTAAAGDLGPFTDVRVLRDAAVSLANRAGAAPPSPPLDDQSCPGTLGAVRFTAVLNDQAVLVDVAATQVVVSARTTCAVIARFDR
jgi:hypothetical protein